MKNQKRIGELKIPFLDTYFKKRGFINSKIIKSWQEIAGELHQWSIPIKITFPKYRNDEGTIHIKVYSSRALEIEMKKKIIINNINIMFGYNAINNIRLLHGKLEQPIIKQKKSTQNHENYFDPKQFKINDKKLTAALKKLGMKLN